MYFTIPKHGHLVPAEQFGMGQNQCFFGIAGYFPKEVHGAVLGPLMF